MTEKRRPCFCGCGNTPVGARARFMPGHDAKYKGILKKARQNKVRVPNPFDPAGELVEAYHVAELLDQGTGLSYWRTALCRATTKEEKRLRGEARADALMKRLEQTGKSLEAPTKPVDEWALSDVPVPAGHPIGEPPSPMNDAYFEALAKQPRSFS